MNVVLNKLNTIASYAAAISLVIILLVTSVSINCFDSDFYKSEYKTLQTAQDLKRKKKKKKKKQDKEQKEEKSNLQKLAEEIE